MHISWLQVAHQAWPAGAASLHTGSPSDKVVHKVNGDFYLTAATVIPVLYLAITLQSPVYQTIIDRLRSSVLESEFKIWPQIRTSAWIIASFVSAAIILLGVFAEYLALHALYYEKSSPGVEQSVLAAAVGLLALTAIGPLYMFFSAQVGALRDNIRVSKEKKAKRRAAGVSSKPEPTAEGSVQPESAGRQPDARERLPESAGRQPDAPGDLPETPEHQAPSPEHQAAG